MELARVVPDEEAPFAQHQEQQQEQQHHHQHQQGQQQGQADPYEALASNPALKMRLELWKKEEEVVNQRIERKEQRLQNTKNEIYQLLGIFFVFQGVILTALAQATNLPKSKLWIPLVLSVLASISTILALWYKLGDCSDLENLIASEKLMAKALYQASDNLKSMGEMFNAMDFTLQPRLKDSASSSNFFDNMGKKSLAVTLWESHMKCYGALLILILVLFSAIMAISCCLIHTDN